MNGVLPVPPVLKLPTEIMGIFILTVFRILTLYKIFLINVTMKNRAVNGNKKNPD